MSAAPKKSYFELAKEAISSLKDRTGSSPQAIKAYITSKYPTIKFAQHLLRAALKKGVEGKKLIKVKASFKVAAVEKKVKKVVKKVVKAATAKKTPTKKPAAKKAAPKKAAAPKAAGTYDHLKYV